MKLIRPKVEIIKQEPGIEGIKKQIEKCGRVCYKSEAKATDGSAEQFVQRMIDNKHTAMLEHGTVYLRVPFKWTKFIKVLKIYMRYSDNHYSRVQSNKKDAFYITTNYRVLVENGWLDDLQYRCEPTIHHIKRATVLFTTDRGISHELVRHRAFSFAQESQRYCNYSKDKFNSEITFILPSSMDSLFEGRYEWKHGTWEITTGENQSIYTPENRDDTTSLILHSFKRAEKYYLKTTAKGVEPQIARTVLPNATKTTIVMTGFVDNTGWQHFFDLRANGTTGKPHPDMVILANKTLELFKANHLL